MCWLLLGSDYVLASTSLVGLSVVGEFMLIYQRSFLFSVVCNRLRRQFIFKRRYLRMFMDAICNK